MLVCRECFESPTLRRRFPKSQPGRCGLCEKDRPSILPVDDLAALFRPFIEASYVRSAGLFDEGPFAELMPSEPLAGVIDKDGLQVFTPGLNFRRRGEFLERVAGSKAGHAVRGWWHSQLAPEYGYSEEWRDFSRMVRHERRYVTAGVGTALLALCKSRNPAFSKKLPSGIEFFRARIWEDVMSPPVSKDLRAPIPKLARAGRANAVGIPVLYVAGEAETAVAEVRPHLGAVVALARVKCTKPLRVFDFAAKPQVAGLDPFARTFEREQRTAKLVAELNREFAEPVAPNDAELDYVPTQAVAEMIQEQGYHGIKYRSAMRAGGHNYTFFKPGEFEVEYLRAVKVTATKLETKEHDPAHLQKMVLSMLKEKPALAGPIEQPSK